jgi:hypothetical protein
MVKKILIISMLLAASVCHAGPKVGQWEISKGADGVLTFQPEYIPYSTYYFAFEAVGHPDEIIVSPRHPDYPPGSSERWRPKGRPSGMYVFVLNLKSETVSLMAVDRFLQLEIVTEVFHKELLSAYPKLNYGGKPDYFYHVMPVQKKGNVFVVAASLDGKRKTKTKFGIPSPIPFMGRKKFFEKETYFSGTILLEVFDKEKPLKPIVQFKKNVRNLERLPDIGEMASWTQGAEQPFLVIVERTNRFNNKKGQILLIRPQYAISE